MSGPTPEEFRAGAGTDDPAVEALIQLVEGDAACLEALVEPVRVLGAEAALAAVERGTLRLLDDELQHRFGQLTPPDGRRLRTWAWFDGLDVAWLGEDAAAHLVDLAREGWVDRIDGALRIGAPERLWLRATSGAPERRDFAELAGRQASRIVQQYRETRTHTREARRHQATLGRALEVQGSLVVLDAWDRLRALELYRDPAAAAAHLRELEEQAAELKSPFATVIVNRHRRRIGGLEDRVVAEVQEVLPDLRGIEAMEARLLLADCLGRIGSCAEAASVAAGHAPPTCPIEEVAAISLSAEVGSQRMLADDLPGAVEALEAALSGARARQMRTEQALIFGNLAMIATMRGAIERGHRCLDAALEHIGSSSASNRAMVDAVRAVLHLRAGEHEAVHQALSRLGGVEETGVTARITAELAAGLAGSSEAFGRAIRVAEQHGTPQQIALCAHFADGVALPSHLGNRVTLRMLGVEPRQPHLRVDPDGRGFETADGRVDLRRHRIASRVLAALARADGPLTTTQLVEAGWPGQKLVPDAAANRLYVTLNQLRKAGLRDWIVREAGGYVLRGMSSVG